MTTPNRRPEGVLLITPERDNRCSSCGEVIPAGESFIADGHVKVHEVCPTRWTARVIEGGLKPIEGQRQLVLPLLRLIVNEGHDRTASQ